jgi:hypothetical protein
VFSDVFQVYPAKRFPGMEESTFLSRSFAEQGLKIRIRKELRLRKRKEPSSATSSTNSLSVRRRTEDCGRPDSVQRSHRPVYLVRQYSVN